MVRDYYSHADPCRETVPRNHQYRYPQTHTFSHKPSNFVGQLHPGRVPHGYYSKRYEPSQPRYMENTFQLRVHGPSVYDSDRRPIGSLCTFDRPSSFHRELKRRGSKPKEAHSQQTRRSQNGLPERYVWNRECSNGKLLQHGSLGSSNIQFHSHSRRFSSNVRRNESGSRFNSGYDEYPRYWASRDESITPNCMNPRHGFLVSPKPHHRKRGPNRTASRFNSGYNEYPRYWASLDSTKSTDSKSNYKPPRKSRRRKAMNLKKHTPSERDRIADNSDSDSDQVFESPTEFTEPIHITWDGDIGKECEHIEQICPVCENDLSYMLPGDYSYYEDDMELPKLPEVAVLPCGHAFHSECLMQFTEEEQSREPPCFLCISYLD